jgi:hypothetical protein
LIVVFEVLKVVIVAGSIDEVTMVLENRQKSIPQLPVLEIRHVLRRAQITSSKALTREKAAQAPESPAVLAIAEDRVMGHYDDVLIGMAPQDVIQLDKKFPFLFELVRARIAVGLIVLQPPLGIYYNECKVIGQLYGYRSWKASIGKENIPTIEMILYVYLLSSERGTVAAESNSAPVVVSGDEYDLPFMIRYDLKLRVEAPLGILSLGARGGRHAGRIYVVAEEDDCAPFAAFFQHGIEQNKCRFGQSSRRITAIADEKKRVGERGIRRELVTTK